jgi:hypothetical protein
MPIVRQSFSVGWAVSFGVIASAIEVARQVSDNQLLLRSAVIVVGCGVGLGGGAFLAFAAPSTPLRSRVALAALWALVGMVAASVNLYLFFHQLSGTYDSYSRVGSVSGLGMREVRVSRSRVVVNARYTIGFTDMAEEVGLIPGMGKYAGSVAGGFVAGYAAGVIATFAPGLLRAERDGRRSTA